MNHNTAILLLGSNIDPVENITQALKLLSRKTLILQQSRVWETEAVGGSGPNYLNVAVQISSDLEPDAVKKDIIQQIENQLGRVRTEDKYAPRTIDIDIILFNGQVMDTNLWTKAFIALPVADLVPQLQHPQQKENLYEIALLLKSTAFAELFKLP